MHHPPAPKHAMVRVALFSVTTWNVNSFQQPPLRLVLPLSHDGHIRYGTLPVCYVRGDDDFLRGGRSGRRHLQRLYHSRRCDYL